MHITWLFELLRIRVNKGKLSTRRSTEGQRPYYNPLPTSTDNLTCLPRSTSVVNFKQPVITLKTKHSGHCIKWRQVKYLSCISMNIGPSHDIRYLSKCYFVCIETLIARFMEPIWAFLGGPTRPRWARCCPPPPPPLDFDIWEGI